MLLLMLMMLMSRKLAHLCDRLWVRWRRAWRRGRGGGRRWIRRLGCRRSSLRCRCCKISNGQIGRAGRLGRVDQGQDVEVVDRAVEGWVEDPPINFLVRVEKFFG